MDCAKRDYAQRSASEVGSERRWLIRHVNEVNTESGAEDKRRHVLASANIDLNPRTNGGVWPSVQKSEANTAVTTRSGIPTNARTALRPLEVCDDDL